MAYFSDARRPAKMRWFLTSAKDEPFYLLSENKEFIAFNKDPDTLRTLWREYLYCRYDFDVSFVEYLKGSGIEAEVVTLPERLRRILAIDLSRN